VKLLIAVVKRKPEPGIEVSDVKMPKIKSDEALIEVKTAAICGSDLGIYDYSPAYSKIMKLPTILGHEFAGRIAKIGPNVKNFNVDDRVVSESVLTCGFCRFCREGSENLCDSLKVFGIHCDGGFAQFAAVPYRHLHRLPEQIPYEDAALIEPLSDTIHMVMDVTKVKYGDFVVVLGCGPLGLFSSQLFKLTGANVILTGISRDKERFKIANRLGFRAINVEKENLIEEVLQLTSGKGADIAFVAVGAPSAMAQACQIISKHGQITVAGIFPTAVEIPLTQIVRHEVVIAGAYATRWSNYEQAIKMLKNGAVNSKALITHKFGLEEAQKAFEVAKSKVGCKVELIPK
jgi:L-iditol 2-dehydrogenase